MTERRRLSDENKAIAQRLVDEVWSVHSRLMWVQINIV